MVIRKKIGAIWQVVLVDTTEGISLMSWRVLWSGPWNTLSQPAIYSFVGRLIQRKLIKLCAKWLEEKEASKGFLHSNSVFIMTLKHACNILEVPLHLLFISVLRSVLNFPFAFPPTAFHCYSSPFSPSSNSSASSVSFQSHFLVIRFFFDVFFFSFYSYSSALLLSSRLDRHSLWWFFDLFSPEG